MIALGRDLRDQGFQFQDETVKIQVSTSGLKQHRDRDFEYYSLSDDTETKNIGPKVKTAESES
jgi:hypothetical protein